MSIIPAPPSSIVNVNKKPRQNRLYTIHNNINDNPFMLRQDSKNEPYIGSTLISFKREIDAVKFSQMIEAHRKSTSLWPSTTLEGLTTLFVRSSILDEPYVPNELYLKTWEFEKLRIYCATNILNLFVLHTITVKDDDIYRLTGQHLTFRIPMEKYADILEKMYEREFIKDIDDEWN
jgi:hypothetical protein